MERREIRKRLVVDCKFIYENIAIKALIVPKSQFNSISKKLAKRLDFYIHKMYGSKYPAMKTLGKGATNDGKKAKTYTHFLVIDKPEYDLVLDEDMRLVDVT
ncbi:2810_t:CDS:2 [Diversispora eburnea]|uniref:2810_t:CDS:1 n=1 Tax=Diversispora eburnea TaxID=1213867 RepID=A0A9N8UZU6_9GLOM|nr:2810_t:CDS:2 [Diversispora eburnea]